MEARGDLVIVSFRFYITEFLSYIKIKKSKLPQCRAALRNLVLKFCLKKYFLRPKLFEKFAMWFFMCFFKNFHEKCSVVQNKVALNML